MACEGTLERLGGYKGVDASSVKRQAESGERKAERSNNDIN